VRVCTCSCVRVCVLFCCVVTMRGCVRLCGVNLCVLWILITVFYQAFVLSVVSKDHTKASRRVWVLTTGFRVAKKRNSSLSKPHFEYDEPPAQNAHNTRHGIVTSARAHTT